MKYEDAAIRSMTAPPQYLWIAYSTRPPFLPIAVADTADQLAAAVGKSRGTVLSAWSRFQRGKLKQTRYYKVKIRTE